jgi:hypothetical protein
MSRKRSHRSKRKMSKKRSYKRNSSTRCKNLLKKKIEINIKEYKKGRYVSRAQAVAVSYSQIKKKHPACRRSLSRRKKSRSRK